MAGSGLKGIQGGAVIHTSDETDDLVSVIMPCYRGDDPLALAAAIGSVLDQTYSNLELIVSIDGPISEALNTAIVEAVDERCRVISSPENCGPAAARNRAVKQCSGHYIALAVLT